MILFVIYIIYNYFILSGRHDAVINNILNITLGMRHGLMPGKLAVL
ncbi:MAG: hypothetical protein JWR38_992 [Mucilaginibacter sp.]|nr:hypothetical protein [Mucilaginibacter sp.]